MDQVVGDDVEACTSVAFPLITKLSARELSIDISIAVVAIGKGGRQRIEEGDSVDCQEGGIAHRTAVDAAPVLAANVVR